MIKFKSVFDSHDRVCSDPGCRFKDELQLTIRPDGSHEFVNVGKNDIYMEIQSHANSCDIHWILDHFQNDPVGREAALNQRQGEYLDTLDYPKTYAEMLQRCIDSRNFFYSLDPEVRAAFNHSVDEFIAQIGTEKWNELVMPKEVKDVVEETVKAAPAASDEKAE